MVEAMGGEEGADYKKFQEYCWSAFQVLRKESNLILNLFSLMVDADIPGITVAGGYKSMLNVSTIYNTTQRKINTKSTQHNATQPKQNQHNTTDSD